MILAQTPCCKGYLFVDIKDRGHRKWIAVHRLVWMSVRGRLVPQGYDIDHRDRNRANAAYRNLRLRTIAANRGDQVHSNGKTDEVPF